MKPKTRNRSNWFKQFPFFVKYWCVIYVCLIPCNLSASWNISADGDARAEWISPDEYGAHIHVVGLSVRKSFADKIGDRVIVSGLFEAHKNFSELMVHELYIKYKGPMGVWNITAGRIGIPYGLLPSFSSTRLLFQTPTEEILGFDDDNGIMVSGIRGIFDYGVSFTQGYGIHHKLKFPGMGFVAGRIGITPGESEEFSVGVSFSGGKTHTDESIVYAHKRITGGVDATTSLRRANIRVQIDAGKIDSSEFVVGYGSADLALHNRFDISAGLRLFYQSEAQAGAAFAGFSVKPPWFTLRGGYTYEKKSVDNHTIALQLYRLFAYSF